MIYFLQTQLKALCYFFPMDIDLNSIFLFSHVFFHFPQLMCFILFWHFQILASVQRFWVSPSVVGPLIVGVQPCAKSPFPCGTQWAGGKNITCLPMFALLPRLCTSMKASSCLNTAKFLFPSGNRRKNVWHFKMIKSRTIVFSEDFFFNFWLLTRQKAYVL